jgi:tetratricopeptide (TPR) repeat protein
MADDSLAQKQQICPAKRGASHHYQDLNELNADLSDGKITVFLPPHFDRSLAPIKATSYRHWLEQDPKTKNHARFCLPLTMASSAGYFILSPATFVVEWDGNQLHDATFEIIDSSRHASIDAHTAFGSFTVQSEFSVKTKRPGDFVYIRGIANQARLPFMFMDAMIEAWWTPARFGLVALLNQAGKFTINKGEPIAQMFVVSQDKIDYELELRDGFPPMYEEWNEAHQSKHEKGKNFTYMRGLWPDGEPLPDGCPHYRSWTKSPDTIAAFGAEQLNEAAFSPEEAKLEGLARKVAEALENGDPNRIAEIFEQIMQTAAHCSDTGYGVLDRFKRIALNFNKFRQFDRAEAIFKAGLALVASGEPKNSPAEAQQLSYLGECYLYQGKLEQSEQHYLSALDLLKSPPYDQSRLYFTDLCGLGQVYNRLGRFSDGERVLKQAIEMRRKNAGPDFSETLQAMNLLAYNYLESERYSQAEAVFKDLLQRRVKVLGKDSPELATSLVDLGFCYRRQNRLPEAESYFKQALDLKRSSLGVGNEQLKPYIEYLAFLLKDSQKFEEAEPLFLELLAIKEATATSSMLDLARACVDLAFLYREYKVPRKAQIEGYFLKALGFVERDPQTTASQLAQHLDYVGYCYLDNQMPATAIPFFERELAILEREPESDAKKTALKRVLDNLHYACFRQGDQAKAREYQARIKKLG